MNLVTGLIGRTGELSGIEAWVAISIVFCFTALTIQMARKTRRDAKIAYETFYKDMSRYKDQECLKTRTLHLKGVLPQDTTGLGVERHLNKILQHLFLNKKLSQQGKVTSVLVIPDFTK